MADRLAETGFQSALDYYYFLRYDAGSGEELEALVENLVVQETYFYRELAALEALVERLLVPRIEAGETLRVWSAACSTGEEPLTLAMMLEARGVLDGVRLMGSDVSERALSKARRGGPYGERAVRLVPEPAKSRWLVSGPDGRYVRPELVGRVDWRRVNLHDPESVRAQVPERSVDVILCRNVLIYFSDETIVRVVDSLASGLVRGGWVVVGASESLLRFGTLLECEEHGGSFFYRSSR